MRPLPFAALMDWAEAEFRSRGSVFGIDRALFYTPQDRDPGLAQTLFGEELVTPIGPAAGPHTQLAQNIVAAWLCGGRFIELKTVQIMDELDIPRPCIDMEDEGYNVEWSQELKLQQSAEEYIHAWALVHLLPHMLGWGGTPPGAVFNMSVGYTLEGVTDSRVQAFLDRMGDASEPLTAVREVLQGAHPELTGVPIPPRVSNNVTVSTMHGCPPDEIEAIAGHLLERGLHTFVKLNPTLLGQDAVMRILHDELGFTDIEIPDKVFADDLQYDQALALIATLKRKAAQLGLTFGVKLSNTLPTANHRHALPGDELYMSGRPLFPITMTLFHKLVEAFDGDLIVSYAAGADAWNAPAVLGCGARTVTAATDLLKPGGYGRLRHWLERLQVEMRRAGAPDLATLTRNARENLAREAHGARSERRYRAVAYAGVLPKVETTLERFDCVTAPCVAQCAVAQDVPEYAWLIRQGAYERALEAVLYRNPLPGVTGYVCTHLCETRCTRINYDEPVAIRELKRFAAERGVASPKRGFPAGKSVAVIGSGPSGLAAAYFLALSGVDVVVYEKRDVLGGMPAIAPTFRLPREIVDVDVARIRELGVTFHAGRAVTESPEELMADGFDTVYVAAGFQRDAPLGIEGEEGEGVLGALALLEDAATGRPPSLGERVLVIGGGNTAMDAARTAQRLTGRPVTVVYRRSRSEMPADDEEIADLLAEGNVLEVLASPARIRLQEGRVAALACVRNELGGPGPDGRRRPVPVPGSEFELPADSIILAVGQRPDVAFLGGGSWSFDARGRAKVDTDGWAGRCGLYAGGDLTRGPSTIVEACADGQRAAEAICAQLGLQFRRPETTLPELGGEEIHKVKGDRVRRAARQHPFRLEPDRRGGFDCVAATFTEAQAREEAARCLQCTTLCDKCVEVCPNRANVAFEVRPLRIEVPVVACEDGAVSEVAWETFEVRQKRQIVHLEDLCNECGNCATFCVHQGRPYEDKPRLHINQGTYRHADEGALHLSGSTLRLRDAQGEARLTVQDGGLVYEDGELRVLLDAGPAIRRVELMRPFSGTRSTRAALELALLLEGLMASAEHLRVASARAALG